jgi:cell wall-associated NlpC family hydrolase
MLVLMAVLFGVVSAFTGTASACQTQPAPGGAAGSIPANYLAAYQSAGRESGIPWTILAGIGTVESGNGQSGAPGVHSGTNPYGAAGPMQFGTGGAAGDTWGGAPIHPASEHTAGYGIDGDHNGIVDVYDPGDAIPSAAWFLRSHGAPANMQAAIFAYNHSGQYVSQVLDWAARYTSGGVAVTTTITSPACQQASIGPLPAGAAGKVIAYAEQQLGKPYQFSGGPGGEVTLNPSVCPAQEADEGNSSGATGVVQAGLDPQQRCVAAAVILYAAEQLGKPYQWGGTGPDAFDCSGLAMMAYRAAGVVIPRTSQQQWAAGPRVPPGWEQPGDLVFFAGSDGTPEAPGHVGIVIGSGEMIEAYATGYPIQIATYGQPSSPPGDQDVVGFTRPA